MTLQVRVSQRAQADVETILTWLYGRSPQGAARWFDKYLDTLQNLPDQADGCPQAPEAATLGRDLRQLLFKTRRGHTYRSLFVIEGDFVQLLAVRGAGQDLLTAEELRLDK
jgi:plasmid stabilization system protein ParE